MKQITIKKKCKVEGCNGELEYSFFTLDCIPQLYAHHCDKCKIKIYFEKVYPNTFLEFEDHEKETRFE